MLPLLNYQSYKITFTIMISLLSTPFPEWFFCSNSKIRNKKNRKKNYKIFKKNLCPDPVSGPVRSTGSGVPIRSGPVRFRKSRSGRLLTHTHYPCAITSKIGTRQQGQKDFANILAKIRDTAIFNRLYIKFVANNGKNPDFVHAASSFCPCSAVSHYSTWTEVRHEL